MALAPAVKGATRPSQQITWTRPDGTAENLTGATITGFIYNTSTGVTRAITGTLTPTVGSETLGIFDWAYTAADVADAGTFTVQFNAAFGSSPTPAKTVQAAWTVHAALSV